MFEKYINQPRVRKATELLHHKEGQGTRYVFLDNGLVPESDLYAIARHVCHVSEDNQSHVDLHRHNCDSAFIFIGNQENLEGLVCEVTLGNEKHTVSSPASVFIPKELVHSYRFISGSGIYMNIVLAGNYNDSIA